MSTVIIFGAGCAGLSAAHFLIQRGYKVKVVETLDIPGGMAKSKRVEGNMPSEYSWRGFGPWYNNCFEVMKTIPYKNSNIYDSHFSGDRLQFDLIPDKNNNPRSLFAEGWRLTTMDKLKIAWLMLDGWCASEIRNNEDYANVYAYSVLKDYLSPLGAQTFSWCYGPFIGSDISRVSSYQTYSFFKKQFFPYSPFKFKNKKLVPGKYGKRYNQNRNNWFALQGPSNEMFFDPWVEYLKSLGVEFSFNATLDKLNYSKGKIQSVNIIQDNLIKEISANYYVLAINPYISKDIIDKTPSLLKDKQLAKFIPLTIQEEHRQVSFRLAFSEKIHLPSPNFAVILTDSEFDITLFSQDSLWHSNIYLGKNIKSLWSGTVTCDSNPGRLYNKEMKYLTHEELIEEIKYQIYRSKEFNKIIKLNNNNKSLESFELLRVEIWPEWNFPGNGKSVYGNQPKWVNTINTKKILPEIKTGISNLYLAGAHTKTTADIWSMEAAVESGRKAADYISNERTVIKQKEPRVLFFLKKIDSFLYIVSLPNVLTCLWFLGIFALIIYSSIISLTIAILLSLFTLLLNSQGTSKESVALENFKLNL